MIVEHAKIHSIVAKLLCLGKQERPDVLLPIQFLCSRGKVPTVKESVRLYSNAGKHNGAQSMSKEENCDEIIYQIRTCCTLRSYLGRITRVKELPN
jgi:hypothetical protein